MKSRPKSRRRKINPNIDSQPDSILDEEQKATQNLFDVSDFYDQVHYERNFNCIFDMFRSVDLDQKTQKQTQNRQKNLRLEKFSSTVRESPKHHDKWFEKDKNKIQQSKFLIKLYESHTQQDSSKSPTLRIRKQKILEKISSKNGRTLTYKAFNSDSVFVRQRNHCESMITTDEKQKKLQTFLNLKNNQNSLIFKKDQKLRNLKKLTDLTIHTPKRKQQGSNHQNLKTIKKISPQAKPHSILLECAQIHRLESLNTVRPLSKTTLGQCSEIRKKGQEKMSPKSMEKSNNKELGKILRSNRTKELSPSRYNETKKRKVFF